MDVTLHNRRAWEKEVTDDNIWTRPVDPDTVAAARKGFWQILLTPTIFVPDKWFGGEVKDKNILCLASGGGQQGPILAAAGARVTVFDNCPAQLDQDRRVAGREGLSIDLVQGDMKDLSAFAAKTFDLIFHPVSNCFIDDVTPVWRECHRVLRPGGRLLSGFCNPVTYIFDLERYDTAGEFIVKYKIPYSDLEQLPKDQLAIKIDCKKPIEFGHSLDSLIGGQIAAGFTINGFYEDISNFDLLDPYIKTFIATLAVKV